MSTRLASRSGWLPATLALLALPAISALMLPRLSLLPSLLPARLLLPLLLLAGDADPRPKSDLEAALGGLSPLSSTASALGSDLVAEGGASYRFSLL